MGASGAVRCGSLNPSGRDFVVIGAVEEEVEPSPSPPVITTAPAPRSTIGSASGRRSPRHAREDASFSEVGGHHSREGEQRPDQRLERLGVEERRAGACVEDRIDDERGRMELRKSATAVMISAESRAPVLAASTPMSS